MKMIRHVDSEYDYVGPADILNHFLFIISAFLTLVLGFLSEIISIVHYFSEQSGARVQLKKQIKTHK